MCCQFGDGSYSVSVNGQEIGAGGNFSSSASFSVGTCPASNPTPSSPSVPSGEGTSPYTTSNCTKVELRLRTDGFPEETAVRLKDVNSGEAFWYVAHSFEPNREYVFEQECLNLKDECYQLTLKDGFGDGLCCGHGDGYYRLYVSGEMVAEGGQFGDSVTHMLGDACD